jgi:hypothetical protein
MVDPGDMERLVGPSIRFAGVLGADLVVWAASFVVAFVAYAVAADAQSCVTDAELQAFHWFFYAAYGLPILLSVAAAWWLASRLHARRLGLFAIAVALAVVALASWLVLIPYYSMVNDCTLGSSFPLDVAGCD